MSEFFKPLRRKLGIVTLLVACLVAAGWVRSLTCVDMCYVRCPPLQNVIVSGQQGIHFVVHNLFRDMDVVVEEPSHDLVRIVLIPKKSVVSGKPTARWNSYPVSHIELYLSESDQLAGRAIRWRSIAGVPYWSIVIPLTLLSAWLLLTKTRMTTPPAIVEEGSRR